VRGRLGGKAVGALHVVEVAQQAELLQNRPRGGCAFGGGGAFAPAERGQRLGGTGIHGRPGVAGAQVDGAILTDPLLHLLRCVVGEHVAEHRHQVKADVAFQKVERNRWSTGRGQHLLDGAADIPRRIEQGAVDIEQVDREARDLSVHYPGHAGCGRSPSLRPGTRRPLSGRNTCCVWSSASMPPGLIGSMDWPLMICITSLPSRISRTSSVSAIFTSASERSLMMASAVSYAPCTSFLTCASMRMAVSSL